MSLSTVTVTWDETDIGQAPLGGSVTFQLSELVADSVDGIDIHPLPPQTFLFVGGTGSSGPLVANDSVNLSPAGSTYIITIAIKGQLPYAFQSAINIANGATQKLAFLIANAAVPTAGMAAYMPLPSGTPAAGQYPIVQAAGSTATAWGMQGTAAAAAVPVPAVTETVVASATVPAGLPAKAAYRITAWGSVAIGGTGGTFVSKVRVGGLAGVQVASASSGAFSSNGTGFWMIDDIVTLQVPGSSGTWSGVDRQEESVSGTNSSSIGAGTATADSTVAEALVATVALSSATSSASCLGSSAERIA